MNLKEIIEKKKRGLELSSEEIEFFVNGFTKGELPDYQMSALLMAICLCGMTKKETSTLTGAMLNSGDTVDLSLFGDKSADKHSTGGVGDKTTLIVAPIVASLGCIVAKMSGRGLGHTGGTVDKLESIKGYRTTLDREQFLSQVKRVGCAVIGQSGSLAPADKKLYALRDTTATVDSIPLIASSIMSKKLASGAHSIVLDVKVGSGAFMKTKEEAAELAREMVDIGRAFGRRVCAVLTNMDTPLGWAVGNSLEVIEAINVLKGKIKGELYDICICLATHMVSSVHSIPVEEAQKQVVQAVESGKAFEKMKEWVSAQGGLSSWLCDTSLFPTAPVTYEVKSPRTGYISKMDSEMIGNAASVLGAGRMTKEDEIDLAAGIMLKAKTGDFVRVGDPLAVLHTSCLEKAKSGEEKYLSAVTFSSERVPTQDLILEIIK